MEQGDIVKAHCNQCSGERNHFIIYTDTETWEDEVSAGENQYELLKCAGCGDVHFRHTNCSTEGEVDDDGKPVPIVTYYPPASIRRQPSWLTFIDLSHGQHANFAFVPDFVSRLLGEVYVALHNNSCSLAAMGIRALLERLMIDHVKDQGSFAKNLTAFEQNGYIGVVQKGIVKATLEVGHASTHRNYNPTRQDLMQVLDIAENVIQSLYVSGAQAKALEKRIPRRERPN